jgi:hypothetical protein
VPPDYPKKQDSEEEKEVENNEPAESRLEKLEDALYRPSFKGNQRDSDLSSIHMNRPVVRSSWQDDTKEKKVYSETVHTGNTYKFLKKILFGSIIIFLASLSVGVYVFLGGKNVVSTKNVIIGIVSPSSVSGGENVPFEVSITNQNNTPLLSADLLIEYSDGGREPDDLTKDLKRYREKIGDIPVGRTINKKLAVVFFGEQGETKDIKATIEYKVSGSNAIFSKSESNSLSLASAPVSVSIDSLSELSSGEETTFSVDITANSNETISSLMFTADYPYGFEFKESDPKPTYGNNTWSLGDLKPGSTRAIEIKGVFTGLPDEEKSIRFTLGAKDRLDSERIGTVFLSKTNTIKINKPFMDVNLGFNGDYGNEYVTKLGNSISGNIVLRNNFDKKLTNITVEAKIKGNIYNKNSVSSGDGVYRSNTDTISWNQISTPALASLEPGGEAEVVFSFNILQSAASLKFPQMAVDVKVSATRIDEDVTLPKVEVLTSKVVKLASALSLSQDLLYSKGPFENTGPIPPKVDTETTYTVLLSTKASTNDLSNVQIKTSLPVYSKWLGNISPENENIRYNPLDGTISWEVGDLKADGSPKEAYFQISFSPSLTQVRGYPALVNEASATAYDKFSGRSLSAEDRGAVDINLSKDPIYRGQGGPVVE